MKTIFITLIMTVSLLSNPLRGQELEHLSSSLFAGDFISVEIYGEYAYCGARRSLNILSVADPQDPSFISGCSVALDVNDICVSGNYAHAVMWNSLNQAFLQVVDISDISHPFVAGQYDDLCHAWDVAASGDYAYVADGGCGLRIFDVSDPTDPRMITWYDPGGEVSYLFLSGNYVYLGNISMGLQIVDISDPEDPEMAGSYGSWAGYVFVSDNRAYVETGGGLVILDVSDPSSPVYLGEYDDVYGFMMGLFVNGDYAYLIEYDFFGQHVYLKIVDVSDPSNPVLVFIADDYPYYNPFVSGNVLYMPGRNLEIMDVRDPENPTHLSSYFLPQSITGVFGHENHAFILDSDGFLPTKIRALNVFDPYNPLPVVEYEMDEILSDITISDDIAYVAASDGLHIFDVDDPGNPEHIGMYGGSFASSVAVQDDYAFITEGQNGIEILDVSDPGNPTLIGGLDTPGNAVDIAVQGDYAYVADYNIGGLRIIDVSDPSQPFEASHYDTPGYTLGVAVQGDYAYVADDYYGLRILDISDPVNPALAAIYNCQYTTGVFVLGDYATVLQNPCWAQPAESCRGNIHLLDISEPGEPRLIDSQPADYPDDVYMTGDLIMLADRFSFEIYGYNQTGIFEYHTDIPLLFSLAPNYPNPFNASTTISYELPVRSDVRLEIYDILGRKVETLVNGVQPAGFHSTTWNAEALPSCLYYYRITAGEHSETGKCILLK